MRCIIGVNAHYITFTVHYIYITFTLHMNTFYIATVSTRLILVSGQFGAGQFGADNSAQDNSAQTIRRDNSSRTIRRKEYNINLLENPALIQKNSAIFFINPASISAILFHQSRLHSSNSFSSIQLPFQQQYFFLNPASISATFFINPPSISAIFFSSVPLPFRQYSSSIPLPCEQCLFVIKYASYNVVIVYNCI